MIVAAQIVGLFAVATFLLSYQQKKRRGIILCNAASRVLYIIQYLMLGAFEGAVLDICGTVSSVMANNKNDKFIRDNLKFTVFIINTVILICGLCMYKDIFSLCPIMGVMLHTSAFWLTNEKAIRALSLLGSPFWLIYNIVSRAYGSAIGDILTMGSIIIAIYRYDIIGDSKSNS